VNTSVASSHAAEKEGEGYKWSQDGDDLEISVEVEADVTKKDLKISFGQEKISVKVKGDTKVELTLFDKIRPDECNWTLSKGKVSLAAYTLTHCNTLQHTAIHCNTLQHTATHCNTLQHTELQGISLSSALLSPSCTVVFNCLFFYVLVGQVVCVSDSITHA